METPPPPADAEAQAEQAHSAAEQALFIFLAISIVNGEPDEDSDLHVLRHVVIGLVKGILSASFGHTGSKQVGTFLPDPVTIANTVAPELLVQARDIRRAVQDPEHPVNRRQAAAALASSAYGRVADALAQVLSKPSTLLDRTRLKKVWLTRRDTKVRPLHRKLHGQSRLVKKDFWRWPATGQALGWPGDPRAPLDATAGCRCTCLLSWSPQVDIDKVVLPLPEEA